MLAGIGALGYLSIGVAGVTYNGPTGFKLFATFDQTGGLKPRAPVVISGVKVGQVEKIGLDDRYRARVDLDLDPRVKIPTDTTASIVTAGLLGDRYISLQLGGDDKMLAPGEEISFTESAVILERLIGKFVHNTDLPKDDQRKPE